MKLVSYNVNSVRARLDNLAEMLERHQPHLVALQETKCRDEMFPHEFFQALGYACHPCGAGGRYNGVALLAKVPVGELTDGLSSDEADGNDRLCGELREPRLQRASISWRGGMLQVVNAYVPHGRSLDDDHYQYKLEFLWALERMALARRGPLVLLGDLNVARRDLDVWNPRAWDGRTHVSDPERDAVSAIEAAGLCDLWMHLNPDERGYTWWSHRGRAAAEDRGLRVDHAMGSWEVLDHLKKVSVDRTSRLRADGSDHAPLVVELDD